ncbi:PTS 2-O-a-mannosyl-D-glycerate transporter subunit IIABC [Enterococcus hulanensis]|uniref:PTS 2-O-a-mannosyl-D-glycerate transporter subunit IIABC n=1 Tax=Enterococcus hulanensis TaxID=2559929 RepID=UPI001A8D5FC9|nr:PTS 2-O-a-mannosyl-D-glycerate transporter subunit IIABC [Enterococcus hulanensis]MBO0458960.1 PTS 2-O-a-mannosyl-D-glycerate transporter subunit IIABC [Enterococcus hulanensis]MDT2658934.1 PTS 2-O-a-mannosyl-D-glycerate transporter subunit IIABC [Enterococcus hulanensis]
MNLANATSQALIFLERDFETREEVFEFMTQKLYEQGKLSDSKSFLEAIYDREKISVTGFENGLAIPHGKSSAVLEASFAVVRLRRPLSDYPSLDPNNKVSLIFMLAIPESEAGSTHLDILAKLAGRLSDSSYLERFKKAKSTTEIIALLDEKEDLSTSIEGEKGLILGITACAAGIAHTYMAAESITKTANQLGYKARIEKQGAKGIEDRITSSEVNEAVGIILAHDVSLKGMERFANIPKIDTTVAEPIKHPEEIINRLLTKVENFVPGSEAREEFTEEDESAKSLKQQIKDSILTGISYIIPIIIAGGMISTVAVLITQIFGLQDLAAVEGSWLFLLKGLGGGLLGSLMIPVLSGYMAYSIADKPGLTPGFAGGLAAMTINSGFLGGMLAGLFAGFLMNWMKKNINANGVFSGFVTFWIYPVVGSLIVGVVMLFLIGKPVAALNNGLIGWLDTLQGSNALLLGAVLGAMVSFDLGGPVNKAAYAFCIAAMSNGNFIPYCTFASVKMVSAFSLSAACLIRKNLFTEQEKEIGNQTWLLGLAGITEGAIPFAMGDPIRVIGSFIGGSIVTGAIVAYTGLGLNVPGAGIFSMFLLEGNYSGVTGALIWFGAAIIGAAISTILLIVTRQQKLRKATVSD